MIRIGATLVCVLALTACGARAPVSDGAADPAAVGPSPSRFSVTPVRADVTGEVREVRVVRVSTPPTTEYAWSVAAFDPSSARIRVEWTDSPDAGCGQADLLQVMETSRSVIIGLSSGARNALACSDVGAGRAHVVALRRPLGTRALVQAVTEQALRGAVGAERLTWSTDPDSLPGASCGAASAAPVGMLDVRQRLAPATATGAVVCRTRWLDGGDVVDRRRITDATAVRSLAATIDRSTSDLHPAAAATEPCETTTQPRFAVVFTGPGLQVPVRTGEPGCGSATNGAVDATTSSELERALQRLFD